jgi:predicted RNA-binding Zn ribbon-like protein
VNTYLKSTETVIDFVNTLDLRPYKEELETPVQLAAWLAAHGLPVARARQADLDRAIAVREALRDLIDGRPEAAPVIERAARDARLELRIADAQARLVPAAGGVSGALGSLVAEVATAMADGTWDRVRLCAADDCRWAFIDTTKNGSRNWCSMRSCGNRAKVQAYRARHR